jgi:hypothetical protein
MGWDYRRPRGGATSRPQPGAVPVAPDGRGLEVKLLMASAGPPERLRAAHREPRPAEPRGSPSGARAAGPQSEAEVRVTSSMVVTPSLNLLRAAMRRVCMPRRIASALISAADAPLITNSFSSSEKSITS